MLGEEGEEASSPGKSSTLQTAAQHSQAQTQHINSNYSPEKNECCVPNQVVRRMNMGFHRRTAATWTQKCTPQSIIRDQEQMKQTEMCQHALGLDHTVVVLYRRLAG